MKALDKSEFHILLVDDEEEIRQAYTTLLTDCGYRVSSAARADLAMELMVYDKVDFLISDVKMPGASGFDLLSLSKIYEEQIPVALISGSVDLDTLYKEGEESVQCFEKPFNFKELLQLIEQTRVTLPVDRRTAS